MSESETVTTNGIIRESGCNGASRWVWFKNADGRRLTGITQYADVAMLTMAEPTFSWSDHWRQGSTKNPCPVVGGIRPAALGSEAKRNGDERA